MEPTLLIIGGMFFVGGLSLIWAIIEQHKKEVERLGEVNSQLIALLRSAQNKAIARDIAAFAQLEGIDRQDRESRSRAHSDREEAEIAAGNWR